MVIPYNVGHEWPPLVLIERMMRGLPWYPGMDIPDEEEPANYAPTISVNEQKLFNTRMRLANS